MFDQLLESRARRQRRVGGTIVSVAVHAGIAVLIVVAESYGSSGPVVSPRPAPTRIIEIIPPPPARSAPGSSGTGGAPRERTRTIHPPVTIPSELPAIDVQFDSIPVAVAGVDSWEDLELAGSERQPAASRGGGSGGAAFRFQVDEPATAVPGQPVPRYPAPLRAAGIEGRVLARFVVDTLGRMEAGSLRIVSADHALFAESVRAHLDRMRFHPATAAGRPVRMVVEMPFVFDLRR